jgi:hypothetical protein
MIDWMPYHPHLMKLKAFEWEILTIPMIRDFGGERYRRSPPVDPQTYRYKPNAGIVEAYTASDRVQHTGVLECRINPHGSIRMNARCSALIAFDYATINDHVGSACSPMAEPQGKAHHARAS